MLGANFTRVATDMSHKFHAYITTLTSRAPNPRAICVYESMESILHFDAVHAHTQPIT